MGKNANTKTDGAMHVDMDSHTAGTSVTSKAGSKPPPLESQSAGRSYFTYLRDHLDDRMILDLDPPKFSISSMIVTFIGIFIMVKFMVPPSIFQQAGMVKVTVINKLGPSSAGNGAEFALVEMRRVGSGDSNKTGVPTLRVDDIKRLLCGIV